ncbi:MAG: glucose-6-phosphate dehydrogenase [Chloroflexi bacterium]|nr:glucose-6-phosphate dehydrogenase [Chloroflexota bacterium]
MSDKIEPHLFVILGALGDLAKRKLFPSVYNLSASEQFGENHIILGVDVDVTLNDESYRAGIQGVLEEAGLTVDTDQVSYWCECRLHYQSLGSGSGTDFQGLAARIREIEQEHGLPGNRLFYLALPSDAVPDAVKGLGEADLNSSPGWTRLVVEKPFGWDMVSAQELNAGIHRYFDESQIYRIDHYLGKETVQNLLVFRFANAFVEHLWNREHIESVQITVAESLGIESRAQSYERAGAVRDMIQNHLTQLLCLVAMEVPSAFKAGSIRHEKLKVLGQIEPIHPDDVVLGQYSGYQQEDRVSAQSNTPTFAALKLQIASWRWKGVPFYLRTGKHLPLRCSQIVVAFERAPVSIFHPSESEDNVKPNLLIITLQPEEGIDFHIQVKSIGDPISLTTQQLSFHYADAFGKLPDAYEHLILDIVIGDQTLFVCDSQIEASWRLYEHLCGNPSIPVQSYEPGTWGPEEMNLLGPTWYNPSP